MTLFRSPYDDLETPPLRVTQQLFQGLDLEPDKVVLVDGPSGREVTAGALKDQIRLLAGGLTERGYGKGAVIAPMAPDVPEYVTVFHGVAWAGGAVTTINPTYTAHEVRKPLDDGAARILIVPSVFLDTARAGSEGSAVDLIVTIDGAEGVTSLAEMMGEPLEAQAQVDPAIDIVVLPNSSGTTGLPKGAMLSHRNLVSNVLQKQHAQPLPPDECTIALLPFLHIYGMTVLMNCYKSAGAKLITMLRFDLEMFLRLVADHGPRRLYVVLPMALGLAKHRLVAQFDVSSLEQIFSGAAPLGGEIGDLCAERMQAVMTEGYGMTELSPVSQTTPRKAQRSGSSGLVVPNCEGKVVDPETREEKGPGEEGELWVKGPNVMLGYLNNAAATRETFTEDGWLRTGDLVVIDGDGYMFVRDRVKELIKFKGFQVASAELCSHPRIADAAVLGKADDEAGEVPVGFVVKAPGVELTEGDVKDHLRGRLSNYKQRAEVHFVDEVPKSASGKILRRALGDRIA